MFKQRKPHPKDKSFALGGFSRGIMYIKFLVLYYKVMKWTQNVSVSSRIAVILLGKRYLVLLWKKFTLNLGSNRA